MTISVNIQRAIEVSRQAVSMLERKLPPFNQENLLPDVILPENITSGSLEHHLLLFYACGWDSRRDADKVYEAVRNMSQAVDLKEIPKLSRKQIADLVHNHLEKQEQEDNQKLLSPEFKEPPKPKPKSQEDPVKTLF